MNHVIQLSINFYVYMHTRQVYNSHCSKSNHTGSAAAMEPVGAVRIFQSSEMKRGLRYTKYLGDRDSSSFKKVMEYKPYGEIDIEKSECVGHSGELSGYSRYSANTLGF